MEQAYADTAQRERRTRQRGTNQAPRKATPLYATGRVSWGPNVGDPLRSGPRQLAVVPDPQLRPLEPHDPGVIAGARARPIEHALVAAQLAVELALLDEARAIGGVGAAAAARVLEAGGYTVLRASPAGERPLCCGRTFLSAGRHS